MPMDDGDLAGNFLSKDEFFDGTQDMSPSSKENLRNIWDSVVQVIVRQADGSTTYGTGFLVARPTCSAEQPKTMVLTNRNVYNDTSAQATIRFFYDSDACPEIQCPVIGFYGPTTATDASSNASMNFFDFAVLEHDFDETLDETTKDRIRQLPPISLEETYGGNDLTHETLQTFSNAVLIGHPSGSYKRISFGTLGDDQSLEHQSIITGHQIPSRPGYSGSPVIPVVSDGVLECTQRAILMHFQQNLGVRFRVGISEAMLKKKSRTGLRIAAIVGTGLLGVVCAPPLAAAAVTSIGFGAGGIVAGSWAAGFMASYGGTMAAGSACAVMQSIGAAGLGAAGVVGLAATGGGLGTAIAARFFGKK
ncbi:hypothetical protein HDU85_004932 [Gaertneriomyces sp. JEL0708]|nr:hypothetical protein HDU85_004932 [Gaertneriomyces sp. JEL0708]